MTVTVCFLTRNHGDCLERAIRSIPKELATVLVADTGSTDATCSIAAAEASRLISLPWHDDFSLACNQTLDAVETEWVLWLNADEELDPAAVAAIQQAIAGPSLFALQLPVRQLYKPDERDQALVGWEWRLFRKVPELRYVSRVHPRFEPPLEELARRRGQHTSQLDVGLDRHVYRNLLTPEKIRWVIRLLEAELAEHPGQLAIEIELGRNLLLLDDPRGHEVLGKCAEKLLVHRESPVAPDPMVGQLLEYLTNVSPTYAKSPIGAAEARELGLRWFSRTPPVLWAIAAERFAAEDYASAVEPLTRLVELGRTREYDYAGGFDAEIIGATPLLNLGICYVKLNNRLAAKTCFAPLLGHPLHGERAKRLYAYCESQG